MIDKSWGDIEEEKRRIDLEKEREDVLNLIGRASVRLKLFFYFWERIYRDFFIRRSLRGRVEESASLGVSRFLWGEGGLFKVYAYSLCGRYRPLRGSRVLVPGAGYGGNILRLASFRPKKILAFDPIDFKKEWDWVRAEALREFGVEVEFMEGAFRDVPRDLLGTFDFVISDAVLMYVRDFPAFAGESFDFLRSGGVFYASFGPFFGSPQGDTFPFKGEEMYNYLLLGHEQYEKRVKELIKSDSVSVWYKKYYETLSREKPFSYLKIEDYVRILAGAGFKKRLLFAQVHKGAFDLLLANNALNEMLDDKKVSRLDRFLKGVALWMQK